MTVPQIELRIPDDTPVWVRELIVYVFGQLSVAATLKAMGNRECAMRMAECAYGVLKTGSIRAEIESVPDEIARMYYEVTD